VFLLFQTTTYALGIKIAGKTNASFCAKSLVAMTAHDEKISKNRRRLFKALSTAPVVATLQPGSALAGSTMQCLANPTDPLNLSDVSACMVRDPDCWAYEPGGKQYWLGSEHQIRRANLVRTEMLVVTAADAVILQSANDPLKFFLWDESVPSATEITFINADTKLEVGPAGNFLRVRRKINTTTTRTVIRIPTRDGIALKLFDPVDENGQSTPGDSVANPPVRVKEYPDTVPDAWAGMPNSNLQGVAATCMTSVNSDGAISDFVLNKG